MCVVPSLAYVAPSVKAKTGKNTNSINICEFILEFDRPNPILELLAFPPLSSFVSILNTPLLKRERRKLTQTFFSTICGEVDSTTGGITPAPPERLRYVRSGLATSSPNPLVSEGQASTKSSSTPNKPSRTPQPLTRSPLSLGPPVRVPAGQPCGECVDDDVELDANKENKNVEMARTSSGGLTTEQKKLLAEFNSFLDTSPYKATINRNEAREVAASTASPVMADGPDASARSPLRPTHRVALDYVRRFGISPQRFNRSNPSHRSSEGGKKGVRRGMLWDLPAEDSENSSSNDDSGDNRPSTDNKDDDSEESNAIGDDASSLNGEQDDRQGNDPINFLAINRPTYSTNLNGIGSNHPPPTATAPSSPLISVSPYNTEPYNYHLRDLPLSQKFGRPASNNVPPPTAVAVSQPSPLGSPDSFRTTVPLLSVKEAVRDLLKRTPLKSPSVSRGVQEQLHSDRAHVQQPMGDQKTMQVGDNKDKREQQTPSGVRKSVTEALADLLSSPGLSKSDRKTERKGPLYEFVTPPARSVRGMEDKSIGGSHRWSGRLATDEPEWV